MAAPQNAQSFIQLLEKSGLLPADALRAELAKIGERGGLSESPDKLARILIQRGLITRYQAAQLLTGRYKGFVLSKYTILDLIGTGGMGRVYLAEHRVMHRKVALKVLPKSKASEPSAIARFEREAQAIAALNHRNIVQAYDIDREGEIHFLVMEYVEGTSAQELVKRRGRIPWRQAAEYARQAALGLAQAHRAGLVHRDVKPANLLIDKDGTVKVLDMGLAMFFDPETGSSRSPLPDESVVGTADYLAPEQTINSHRVDIRADLYALGGTLYFMLTSQPPFPGGSVVQKLEAHRSKSPRPVRDLSNDVPSELVAVVDRMMAKDPADRFQSPVQVEAALRPFASNVPVAETGFTEPLVQSPADDDVPLFESVEGGGSSEMATDEDVVDFFAQLPETGVQLSTSGKLGRVKSAIAAGRPEVVTQSSWHFPRRWVMSAGVALGLGLAALIGTWFLQFGIGTNPEKAGGKSSAANKTDQTVGPATTAQKAFLVPSRNYPQLDVALSEVGANETVLIKEPGPWKTLTLKVSPAFFDEKHNVTIAAERPNTVLVRTQADGGPLVLIDRTRGFTLRNLVFDGGGRPGPLVEIRGPDVGGLTIDGCSFRNYRGLAISIVSADGAEASPIRLRGLTFHSSDAASVAVQVGLRGGKPPGSRHLLIEGCRFVGPFSSAIWITEPAAFCLIDNNSIAVGDTGILLDAAITNSNQLAIRRNHFENLKFDVRGASAPELAKTWQSGGNRWTSVAQKADSPSGRAEPTKK